MVRPAVPLAILAAMSLACSTTKYVGAPATPASIAAVEAEHPDVPIYVESLQPWGEARSGARVVRTTPDLTIVVAEEHSPELSLPIGRVRRLRIVDHAQGAGYGAGVGLLLAAAVVATVALTYEPCKDCFIQFSRGEESQLAAVFLGVPLILVSTGVGALIGARTRYVFE